LIEERTDEKGDSDRAARETVGDYRLQLVAAGLSYPTSLTFDAEGVAYVAESGLTFSDTSGHGRIWRIAEKDSRCLVKDGLRTPVNGLTFKDGSLYVSEGGFPGRIQRIDPDGVSTVILDNLPGPGNYHTNMVAFGHDNKMYFSQGAMTNTGIIGLDAYELGWLRRLPQAHDIPGYDLVLVGTDVETDNPLGNKKWERTKTGAFVSFGSPTQPNQRIAKQLPCTAGIMRCALDGSNLELVAWGLRNAYGLGFLPDGRLIATDQGADDRGSRPVGNAPDLLFQIQKDSWYGWPDFIGGEPITDAKYKPGRGPQPSFLLANHGELPAAERPLIRFPPHSAAVKFDAAPAWVPEWKGQIFVALFGDERPMTAPNGRPVGRCVMRINPDNWTLYPFISEHLLRPIDVRFNPVDASLYILDFGRFEINAKTGVIAPPQDGRLWRITM
jgi:glucose/arabinose dehydrogenase